MLVTGCRRRLPSLGDGGSNPDDGGADDIDDANANLPTANGAVTTLRNRAELSGVIADRSMPCAVLFMTTWSSSAAKLARFWAALADISVRVRFYQVDVDRAGRIDPSVTGCPTALFYYQGAQVGRIVGGDRVKIVEKVVLLS